MDETAVVVIVAIVVVIVLVALAMWFMRRQRSRNLQDRFGPEYDRTLDDAESRREAEQELRERERRRDELNIVPLDDGARARYSDEWRGIQERFVDAPTESVAEADVLVMQVMRERGYPVDDFERRTADISVDHPEVVSHYRAGHDVAQRSRAEGCDTEELREAVVHYRALFEALLEDRPDMDLTDRDDGDDRTVDVTENDASRSSQTGSRPAP